MKEDERKLFIRYSPSFGLRGLPAYQKFKDWEFITGKNNLTYYYDKDEALVITEMSEKERNGCVADH